MALFGSLKNKLRNKLTAAGPAEDATKPKQSFGKRLLTGQRPVTAGVQGFLKKKLAPPPSAGAKKPMRATSMMGSNSGSDSGY